MTFTGRDLYLALQAIQPIISPLSLSNAHAHSQLRPLLSNHCPERIMVKCSRERGGGGGSYRSPKRVRVEMNGTTSDEVPLFDAKQVLNAQVTST